MIYQFCKDFNYDVSDFDGFVISFGDLKNDLKLPTVIDCSFVSTEEILKKNLKGKFFLLNLNEESIKELQEKNKDFYGHFVVNLDDVLLTENFCLKHGIDKFFLETKDKTLNDIHQKIAALFDFCAFDGIWPEIILTSPDVYNPDADLEEFSKFYNNYNKEHVSVMTKHPEVYRICRYNRD